MTSTYTSEVYKVNNQGLTSSHDMLKSVNTCRHLDATLAKVKDFLLQIL